MPNRLTNTDDETTEYTVHGWANLAPSCTIEIPTDGSIEDITTGELVEALRDEIERMGYDPEEFGIEIHEVVEKL